MNKNLCIRLFQEVDASLHLLNRLRLFPEEQDFLLQSDQIAQIEKKDQTIIHSCVETVRSQSVGVREYYRDLIARNGWDCVKYAKEIAAELNNQTTDEEFGSLEANS